jgi:tetratricopeptide (TPR) repeat protein
VAKSPALTAVLLIASSVAAGADYRLECPSHDIDRAIRGCSIAIGTGGANLPTAYATRCVAHWLKGAYARAAPDCDEAIHRGANSAAAYLLSGITHAEKGDQHAAVADYTRSLELRPTSSAYYNRGTAYASLGDFALALPDLDRAIEGQPPVPQAHINRALVLLASGRGEEIAADLDRAVYLLHGDAAITAIRNQALDSLGREGGPNPPVQLFPPSKVVPDAISLESLSAQKLKIQLGGQAGRAPAAPVSIRDQEHRISGATLPRDSMAECLRLWHPETRVSQRHWKEICRQLDFNVGGKKH